MDIDLKRDDFIPPCGQNYLQVANVPRSKAGCKEDRSSPVVLKVPIGSFSILDLVGCRWEPRSAPSIKISRMATGVVACWVCIHVPML